MALIFHALSIGALALLYGSIGLVIGFAVGFVPLRLVQVLATPPLLTDGVLSIASLTLASLFAFLAGIGFLRARR
ncbi:MAG: hypothetical protein J0H54_12155 [Rhizobiales bacterium]|nr:hypothetical protein [Hyphomicrobiales bacterium]